MKMNPEWSAWRMGDETRVQIHRPDLAKAFGKQKSARQVGYGVAGRYTKLFHVKQPVDWVNTWMKNSLRPNPASNN